MTRQETWTTLKIIGWTKEYLAGKGIENARLEAEWLLCAATGLDRVGLYLNFDKPMNEAELSAYRSMVARRARREPLQHILGSQEFCGFEFEVSPDVLIPRHDTETLVEEALLRAAQAASVLDVGTGSGCVAVALAKRMPAARVSAIDVSARALEVAKRNAARNGVDIEFLLGSFLEPSEGQTFDLIVSNPPYIPSADIEELEPEVRDWDPRCALDGGSDGLSFYRILIPAALRCLNLGAWLLLEVGMGQSVCVSELFGLAGGYDEAVSARDFSGIERVVGARRKEE